MFMHMFQSVSRSGHHDVKTPDLATAFSRLFGRFHLFALPPPPTPPPPAAAPPPLPPSLAIVDAVRLPVTERLRRTKTTKRETQNNSAKQASLAPTHAQSKVAFFLLCFRLQQQQYWWRGGEGVICPTPTTYTHVTAPQPTAATTGWLVRRDYVASLQSVTRSRASSSPHHTTNHRVCVSNTHTHVIM